MKLNLAITARFLFVFAAILSLAASPHGASRSTSSVWHPTFSSMRYLESFDVFDRVAIFLRRFDNMLAFCLKGRLLLIELPQWRGML